MSRAPDPRERRRVLLVINSLARGGAETQLIGLAKALHRNGDDVVVATLRGGNDFADEIAREGLEVWAPEHVGDGWPARHLLRLAVRIVRWRPQVTVSFLLQATLFVRAVNLLARPRRSVASMRNEKLETALRSRIYRASCASDDVIVVNSTSACAALQASRTIPRDERRVAVIYNGVDASGIRARATADPMATRRALGVAPEETMVLGVGRLDPQKDWHTLIDAAALTGSRTRFVVAGEGHLAEELTRHAADAGVSDRFTFVGLRSDVPDLLAAADCLALSSTHEGTPNIVLEALAMGTPVVATDVGACRELLGDGAGTIVPVADAPAMGTALSRLPRCDRTESSGAPVERFGWDVIGRQWADVVHGRSPS